MQEIEQWIQRLVGHPQENKKPQQSDPIALRHGHQYEEN